MLNLNPFHEVYSTKDEDGKVHRVHYATDDKGLRANFYSNSLKPQPNYAPIIPPSPFMLPLISGVDQMSDIYNNPAFLQNLQVPDYGTRVSSRNDAKENIQQTPVNWVNSIQNQGQNQNIKEKLNEFESSLLFSTDHKGQTRNFFPNNINKQQLSNPNIDENIEKETDSTKSANLRESLQAKKLSYDLKNNSNIPKQVRNSDLTDLFQNEKTDFLRIRRPNKSLQKINFGKSQLKKVNSNPQWNFFDYELNTNSEDNGIAAKSSLSSISTNKSDKSITPKVQAEFKNAHSSLLETKYIPTSQNNEAKPMPISNVVESKIETPTTNDNIMSDLEKIHSSLLKEHPVSTVFDISNDNGRYYHYILNAARPTEINPKYFSTGNALLKLLDESGISYIKDYDELSKEKSIETGTFELVTTPSNIHQNSNKIPAKLLGNQNKKINANGKSKYKVPSSDIQLKVVVIPNETKEANLFVKEPKIVNVKYDQTTKKLVNEISTSTNKPTTANVEATVSSFLTDETETQTFTTLQPTKAPLLINSTEDIDTDSLFVTITVNRLLSTASSNTPESESLHLTENLSTTTTDSTQLAESTASEESRKEKYENSTSDPDIGTTVMSTYVPVVTATVESTTYSQKVDTTTIVPTTISSLTTTVEIVTEASNNSFAALDENHSDSEKNDSNPYISPSPGKSFTPDPAKILLGENAANPSMDSTSNSTKSMIIIQISNINELKNFPMELMKIITNMNQISVKNEENLETETNTSNEPLFSGTVSVPENDSFQNDSPISLPSEQTFQKQKSVVKTFNETGIRKNIKDDLTPVKYALVQPVSVNGNANNVLDSSPNIVKSVRNTIIANSNDMTIFPQSQLKKGNHNGKPRNLISSGPTFLRSKPQLTSESDLELKKEGQKQIYSIDNDMISHFPLQLSKDQKMKEQNVIKSLGNRVKIANKSEKDKLVKNIFENSRIPQENQVIEEYSINRDNYVQNLNPMDLSNGYGYIEILPLNSSLTGTEPIQHLEIIEYVPIESIGNKIENNPIRETNNMQFEEPIVVFEDYIDQSNYPQQNAPWNIISEARLEPNQYPSFTENQEGSIFLLQDSNSYVTRLQHENFGRQPDVNEQFRDRIDQSSLSKEAPWMK